MHKIDAPGHSSNEFTEGDPGLGIPATTVGAKWLTTMQRELVAVVLDAGISLNDTIDDQVLQAIKILAGGSQVQGFKNLAPNPQADIWQRTGIAASSVATPGDYVGPDRWWLRPDSGAGTGTGTVQRVTFPFGVAIEGHPLYYARHIKTANPTVAPGYKLGFHIYDIDRFHEETITWSIYLASESGTPQNHTMRITVDYGAGGSADDIVVATVKSVQSFVKHSVSGTFPDFFAKTKGTLPKVIFEIEADSSTHGGIHWVNSQVEIGSSASSFARQSIGDTWADALRHFITSYPPDVKVGTASTFDGECIDQQTTAVNQLLSSLGIDWPAPLWQLPVVKWYGPGSGTVDRITIGGTDRTVTSTSLTTRRRPGYANFGAAHSGTILAHYTADAEEPIT